MRAAAAADDYNNRNETANEPESFALPLLQRRGEQSFRCVGNLSNFIDFGSCASVFVRRCLFAPFDRETFVEKWESE